MFGKRTNMERAGVVSEIEEPRDSLETLWKPEDKGQRRVAIEQLLLERGHITSDQLAQARSVQSQTPGKSIAQILLTMNATSEAKILSALAETINLPFEVPDRSSIEEQTFALLPVE